MLLRKSKDKKEEEDETVFEIRVSETINEKGVSSLNFNLYILGQNGYGWSKTGVFSEVKGGDKFILSRSDIESMYNNNKKDTN